MSSAAAESAPTVRRGLRWWQWLLFFLPGIVTVAATRGWIAYYRAKDEASGFTLLSNYGREQLWFGGWFYGLIAGAVCCVICGIILGVTTRQRLRTAAAIGWTLLSALTNLPLAVAGYILTGGIAQR